MNMYLLIIKIECLERLKQSRILKDTKDA